MNQNADNEHDDWRPNPRDYFEPTGLDEFPWHFHSWRDVTDDGDRSEASEDVRTLRKLLESYEYSQGIMYMRDAEDVRKAIAGLHGTIGWDAVADCNGPLQKPQGVYQESYWTPKVPVIRRATVVSAIYRALGYVLDAESGYFEYGDRSADPNDQMTVEQLRERMKVLIQMVNEAREQYDRQLYEAQHKKRILTERVERRLSAKRRPNSG
jgi:hypothetical protein